MRFLLRLFIALITVSIIGMSVFLYTENQALINKIQDLQVELESIKAQKAQFESNWARTSNQLTMCKETNWAQEFLSQSD